MDIVGGLEKAVSGATGAGDPDPDRSSRKVRLNKPVPQSYGGTAPDTDSYKRGGKVKRTGMAKVHKGERVLTTKQSRKYAGKRGRK